MPQIPVTISGNLTADPEFRRFDTGTKLTKLRIASSRRARVKVHNEQESTGGFADLESPQEETYDWTDVDVLYIDAECWGELAVNTAGSLKKGMPVVAIGYLVSESWDTGRVDEDRKPIIGQRIKLRADQVSFEMSRHQLASAKVTNATHTPEGVPAAVPMSEEDLISSGRGRTAEVRRDTPGDAGAAGANTKKDGAPAHPEHADAPSDDAVPAPF